MSPEGAAHVCAVCVSPGLQDQKLNKPHESVLFILKLGMRISSAFCVTAASSIAL